MKLTFNLLALLAALALALALSLGAVESDTLYRTLAAGRVIATQGHFPDLDPFVYSLPASAGFDKEAWLFSLLSFALHSLAGLKALALLRSLLLLGCFILMLATGFRRDARPFSSALTALAVLYALQPWSALNPLLAGLFCFALCLFVMEGFFWTAFFARWIWLPVLLTLWVNLHASAFLLLPLAVIWAYSDAEDGPEAPSLPGLARLSTLGLSAACLFLHPSLWRAPLALLQQAGGSPFEADAFASCRPALLFLAGAALLHLASAVLPQGRPRLSRDSLVFGCLAAGSLLTSALLPFALVYAAPMAAGRADAVIDALPLALRRLKWLFKAAALGAVFWALPSAFAKAVKPVQPALPASLPSGTLDFIRKLALNEGVEDINLMNEFNWSGRLLWELGPGARLFTDGRRGAALDYARVLAAQPAAPGQAEKAAWEGILERYGTQYALLRINSPLSKAMARSAYWQPVDFDDVSVLYASVIPAHAALIKTYAPRGLRPGDLDEPFESSRLPQVEADLEARRLGKPALGILYYFEARYWLDRGKESLARQWLEKGIQADPGFAANYRQLAELRVRMGDKKGAQSFFDRAADLGGL